MKNRLFISLSFWAIFVVACGVDPLDPGVIPGDPSRSPGRELSVCDDTTLPDCNNDGTNDQCAELLGLQACGSTDQNNNGVDDRYELPPNPAPGPEGQAATSWLKENGFGLTSTATTLANSGLNKRAPNGTKVDVQQQYILIFTQGASPSGLDTTNSALPGFCRATAGQTYLYYKVAGDVTYCAPTTVQGTENCEGTPKHSQLELCGPLSNTSGIANGSGAALLQSNFNWKYGKVSNDEKFNGEFQPEMLYRREGTTTDLTLTPSQLNSQYQYFGKEKVKFKNSFKIEGWIYSEEKGGWIKVETPKNIEVERNFQRSGTVNSQNLFMRGLYGAN